MIGANTFKDHFSDKSPDYARYRPTYPGALFRFLVDACEAHDMAWDCATGNGQAAVSLAPHFKEVVATDASEQQIASATPAANVSYHVAPAENSGLADDAVSLVTVGQAFHWFDQQQFFDEAQRTLVKGGVLAVWCYALCTVNDECDNIVAELYENIVGDFWLPERVQVEAGYADVAFPGVAIDAPPFDMSIDWSVDDMLGYLRTWSACKRFETLHGDDPVAVIEQRLQRAWGQSERKVVWPLIVRACRT